MKLTEVYRMSEIIFCCARSAAIAFVLMLGAAALLHAQNNVIFLWPNGAPGSENWTQKEVSYKVAFPGQAQQTELRNVVKPSITAYLPQASEAKRVAVIVAPGGGFTHLAWENEGTRVAEWLQRYGVAAFVLKYRCIIGMSKISI